MATSNGRFSFVLSDGKDRSWKPIHFEMIPGNVGEDEHTRRSVPSLPPIFFVCSIATDSYHVTIRSAEVVDVLHDVVRALLGSRTRSSEGAQANF